MQAKLAKTDGTTKRIPPFSPSTISFICSNKLLFVCLFVRSFKQINKRINQS
nr:MAG TPA: hypothetical protein [Caudoviricetes sp.]